MGMRCVLAALLMMGASAFAPSLSGGLQLSQGRVARAPEITMISHRKGFKKLGKPADQRKALLRALTTECIRHGRITTTFVRAKEVKKHVDHMIQLGKRGDLHARRQVRMLSSP